MVKIRVSNSDPTSPRALDYLVHVPFIRSSLTLTTAYNTTRPSHSDPPTIDFPCPDFIWFDIYRDWLYYKKLPRRSDLQPVSPNREIADVIRDEYYDLLNCYVLGARAQDAGFQNAVMNALVERLRSPTAFPEGFVRALDPATVRDLWLNTSEGDGMRSMVAQTVVTTASEGVLMGFVPEEGSGRRYHAGFLRALMCELARMRPRA